MDSCNQYCSKRYNLEQKMDLCGCLVFFILMMPIFFVIDGVWGDQFFELFIAMLLGQIHERDPEIKKYHTIQTNMFMAAA